MIIGVAAGTAAMVPRCYRTRRRSAARPRRTGPRSGIPAAAAMIDRPLSMRGHAGQLRRLRGRPQARRHPGRGHQRLREPPGLLRLGGAVRSRRTAELDEMARGIRPARARRRGRAQGPPARPRSRSTATRCSPCCTPSRWPPTTGRSSIGEVDVFVGPQLRAVGAPATPQHGFAACAPAPSTSPNCCATAPGSCSTR